MPRNISYLTGVIADRKQKDNGNMKIKTANGPGLDRRGTYLFLRLGAATILVLALLSGCAPIKARPGDPPIVLLGAARVFSFPGANSPPEKREPGETDCNSPLHWD